MKFTEGQLESAIIELLGASTPMGRMMNDDLNTDPNIGDSLLLVGEFLLYTTEDGKSRVECRFENETLWLSQALIGGLYDRSKKTISEHLKNLFEEGELVADSVVRNFRTTAADGKSYDVQFYNLEVAA